MCAPVFDPFPAGNGKKNVLNARLHATFGQPDPFVVKKAKSGQVVPYQEKCRSARGAGVCM